MRTLGIDLAARPPTTACCTVEWQGSRARIAQLTAADATDEELLGHMVGAQRVGIDCPLGWPVEFVRTVAGWTDLGPWEPSTPEQLTLRVTDRLVAARVRRPLSVSADKIAVVAFRCAALLDRFARVQGASAVDRSGTTGTVAEVYPAAALVRWSWFGADGESPPAHRASYRRGKGRRAREELVAALAGRLPWLDLAGHGEDLVRSDDAFDALVAALVARAVALGLTEGPETGEQLAAARREGWIHVPSAGCLDELVG